MSSLSETRFSRQSAAGAFSEPGFLLKTYGTSRM
jgi:hypothetical protein